MELTYNELRKRDVINVSDGRCLGRIIDMRLDFPEGILVGIVVPGRKVRGIFKLFDKSQLYIDERHILKIGGDVILVDINCGDMCADGIRLNNRSGKKNNCTPSYPPNKPHCPPPCPPCPPKNKPNCNSKEQIDFSILSGGCNQLDDEDY